jgi:phage tail protein X
MARSYTTREGDRLDLICWDHYGGTFGFVESVLDANRGLADYGPILPAGVVIVLPEIAVAPSTTPTVRIWD